MKKIISVLLSVIMAFGLCVFSFAAEKKASVEAEAKAYVLMDIDSGKVLAAKNENKQLYPASITKVMALILIMEAVESGKIALADMVTTTENAQSFGGSQIWLEVGEQMSVDDMLKAVVVASANDACTALGEYIAGSSESFVAMMNEKAKQLGMKNTHFDNCTGLDDETETHLSTAYDIAVMSRELMQYDKIKEYSTIWMDSLRNGKTELVNTNRLVRFYEGCTGLKTGTTTKAGFCISATAKRGNTSLAAVVLGAENSEKRFAAAQNLLNWGFANYESVKADINLSQIGSVQVNGGEKSGVNPIVAGNRYVLTEKGSDEKLETKIVLPASLNAPVKKNQMIGRVEIYLGKDKIDEIPLCAEEGIKKLNFWSTFLKLFESTVKNL